MARISNGDALTTALLQPGAKFGSDGYGLVTGTAIFKEDAAGSTAFLARNQACTVPGFTFCTVHKATSSVDALGINTYTVDYVGIGSGGISSSLTTPQVGVSQGLSTEHITSHQNFFVLQSGFTGVIAGVGTGSLATPAYPLVAGSDPAEYEGENGARFQATTGGKFLGFKKPSASTLYGRTSYLAPQTSFSGHFYTSNDTNVTNMIANVGKSRATNTFSGIPLLPSYMGTTFTAGWFGNPQLLLAQVGVEDFGTLRKVTYEIRFNREGYNQSVYAAGS